MVEGMMGFIICWNGMEYVLSVDAKKEIRG